MVSNHDVRDDNDENLVDMGSYSRDVCIFLEFYADPPDQVLCQLQTFYDSSNFPDKERIWKMPEISFGSYFDSLTNQRCIG